MDFRIFGRPMLAWLQHMPKGMLLKSEGFASSLFDPNSEFTLQHYCSQNGLPYADEGLPVPLETFAAYGLEFQKRFVPHLEQKELASICRSREGFELRLADGEVVSAQKAIVAVGVFHFAQIPPPLSSLPQEFVTHSSRHGTLEKFKGREVIVLGSGASAVDLAVLLHRAGAAVRLVARRPAIRFHDPPDATSASPWQRLRSPLTGIGPGWKLFFCANAPQVFRLLPKGFRFEAVRRILGPAPGWFMKDQMAGNVPCTLGVNLIAARIRGHRVLMELSDPSGTRQTLLAEHVIAATGYKVDLRRLAFLDSTLCAGVQCLDHTPVLSSNFESSVPGLYFVGPVAAHTFGPLLRFAFGAKFTARRLANHLAPSAARLAVTLGSVPGVGEPERPEMRSQ